MTLTGAVSRCMQCRGKGQVYGHGSSPARLLLIGEKPGPVELKTGLPWSGPAGEELNRTFLRIAHLDRVSDTYTTNVSMCDPPTGWYLNQYLACGKHHLRLDLELAQPEAVVLMGWLACQMFGIKEPLERIHGIPMLVDVPDLSWSGLVWPTLNPAAAMRDEGSAAMALWDWHQIGRWLSTGDLDLALDDVDKPTYRVAECQEDVDKGLSVAEDGYIAVDTEDDNAVKGRPPWCLTWAVREGEAWMILDRDWGLLRYWISRVRGANLTWVYHHSLHDVMVLERMGIAAPHGTGSMEGWPGGDGDTLQVADHLGLDRGLKVLARRLCGMRMSEYTEVVGKWGMATILYLNEVVDGVWEERLPTDRSHSISKLAGKILVDTLVGKKGKDGKAALVNPVERWKRIDWERRQPVEEVMGEIPLAGLSEIDEKQAVDYACRDADATFRVWMKLRSML